MPSGVIAISPWVDLTASGESYEKNREKDPSMSAEALEFFANSYTKDKEDPLVSPLLAELSGMPPSLIFAGGDEILLSDSELLHGRLCESGDILQEGVCLPCDLARGELLAMLTTGAYQYSMASNYNRIPRPAVVMLKGGEASLAVRRETVEDLVALDV